MTLATQRSCRPPVRISFNGHGITPTGSYPPSGQPRRAGVLPYPDAFIGARESWRLDTASQVARAGPQPPFTRLRTHDRQTG
jgi:hypothetical protein